jgi:hypothetical protein
MVFLHSTSLHIHKLHILLRIHLHFTPLHFTAILMNSTAPSLRLISHSPNPFPDRPCGLVVRVLGYRSGGPGSIPGTTRKKVVVGLERGPLSLVSTTDELLDRKVAALV